MLRPSGAAVLMKGAKRWRFRERDYGVDAGGSLEYAVRLRRDIDLQELTRRLRQETGGIIHTLEWRAGGENNGKHPAHWERADGRKQNR